MHWHGLTTDSLNDGAMEEGSPMIPAGGLLRYHLTPNPAGSRWYHTHVSAGAGQVALGTYTGQFGFLLVEGAGDPGHYDQEVFLAIHHWQPSLRSHGGDHAEPIGPTHPADLRLQRSGYQYATINQHRLGAGEPLRVEQGQRVLPAPAECQRRRKRCPCAARPHLPASLQWMAIPLPNPP